MVYLDCRSQRFKYTRDRPLVAAIGQIVFPVDGYCGLVEEDVHCFAAKELGITGVEVNMVSYLYSAL